MFCRQRKRTVYGHITLVLCLYALIFACKNEGPSVTVEGKRIVRGGSSDSRFEISVPEDIELGKEVTIAWQEVSGAESYDLVLAEDPVCKNALLKFVKLTTLYQAIVFVQETTYYVCVVANLKDKKGQTTASNNGTRIVVRGGDAATPTPDANATATPTPTATATPVLPQLTSISDQTFPSDAVIAGNAITAIDVDDITLTPDADTGMTYTCVFDQVIDGAVAGSTNCSTLSGTPNFNTGTGVLTWTTSADEIGSYEFKITGTNSGGSDTEIFVVTVRQGFSLTNLQLGIDSYFANGGHSLGKNSPFTSSWFNFGSLGSASNGALTSFAETVASGWAGAGTSGSPYRLVFDGTNDLVDFGNGLGSNTNLLLSTWIKPTSLTNTGTILGNMGAGGNGFALRQSATFKGYLEFSIGQPDFSSLVTADSPSYYWRLGESATATAADSAGTNTGTYQNTPTLGQTGIGAGNTAVLFNGTDEYISTATQIVNPNPFSIEMWFKSSSATEQVLASFAADATGAPGAFYDRHLYLSATGEVRFASDCGDIMVSAAGFADGQWHHVVAIQANAGTGMELWVDGVLRDNNTTCTPVNYTGYWRFAYNKTWTGGVDAYFNGYLDEIAIYPYVLTGVQIAQHFVSSRPCRTRYPTSANEWLHVGLRFVGASSLAQLYLNGASTPDCSLNVGSSVISSAATDFVVGARADATHPWNGEIAQLNAYSSGSAADNTTHYNATKSIGANTRFAQTVNKSQGPGCLKPPCAPYKPYVATSTFAAGADITADAYSTADFAIGDFTGDGHLDIITVEYDDNQKPRLYTNNGSASFTGSDVGSTNMDGASIEAGDIDNDDDLDFIVKVKAETNPKIYINTGSGSFTGPTDMWSGALSKGQAAKLGDLNNDGNLDYVIGSWNSGPGTNSSLLAALGNGNGTFQEPITVDSSVRDCPTLELGDLNGDGKLDIMISETFPGPNTVRRFINNWNGIALSFTGASLFSGNDPSWMNIQIADSDGDLDLDLAINARDDGFFIYENNGSASFTLMETAGALEGGMKSPGVADLNLDGYPDFLVTSHYNFNFAVYWGLPNFQVSGGTDAGAATQYPCKAEAADFNGDGKADVVVGNGQTGAGLGNITNKIYLGQ